MDATYWRGRIASELSTLDQQEFVIVGEPEEEPAVPTGLLGKVKAKVKKPTVPSRWGQVLCLDEVLFAEFVGTTHIGGTWEATDEQHEAVRAAGWLTPDETDPIAPTPTVPHYWRTVPQPECELIAELMVEAFTILGADLETLWLRREQGRQ